MSVEVANPLIAARQDSTTAYAVFIAEDIDALAGYTSGGWIDVAIGGVALHGCPRLVRIRSGNWSHGEWAG